MNRLVVLAVLVTAIGIGVGSAAFGQAKWATSGQAKCVGGPTEAEPGETPWQYAPRTFSTEPGGSRR